MAKKDNLEEVTVEVDEETGVQDRNGDGTALRGEKTMVGISVSKKFGEAIADFANKQKPMISMAELGRKAIAKFIGYDLSTEPLSPRGPRQKYNTPEERIAAQKAQQAERNELIKKLLADYRAKNQTEGVEDSEDQ